MPKVNGKEYPYTATGKAAAKKAEQNKKKPATGKPKKAAPAKPAPRGRYPGPGYDETGPSAPRLKQPPKRIPNAPSKMMNKAIPGNKGIDLGATAKKFVMSMPPVMAARGAMAAGKAINDRINPPARQMMRGTTKVGDMLRKPARPTPTAPPLNQLRPMPDKPKRKPKTLLPKKPGR
jgi:hypothetical protein